MAKRNKTISMDEKVFERLQEEDNASQLIEDLLNSYYGDAEPKPEELVKQKDDVKQDLEEAKEKLKEIKGIEKKLTKEETEKKLETNKLGKLYKKYSKRLIDDLIRFEELTSTDLYKHWQCEYSKWGLSFFKVKDAYEALHGSD